ncbi:MAG TPA: PQQ-binding-like beta-propeller repeat protein [Bryobacteraceae bacterium]|nr:PQQ-binding-like beta-propeller repeat protein [Bryobacteraceae bacterium]
MRRIVLRLSGFGFALAAIMALPAAAQTGAKNGDWTTYGGDLGNTRYAPLNQIDASNFNKLQVAWRFHTDNLGPRPEYNLEGTPLVANGVMYATAGTRRSVVAVDAATGELLWTHGEREGKRGQAAPRQLSGRGLAYWTDGREERILYVTPGYRLIALNAKTGAQVAGFGTDGVVDLKLDDDQDIDLVTGEVGLHSSPVVAKDVVIVGAAHRSGGVPRARTNVKGYVRAFDVRTGKRLWIFHTIPKPNEVGYNTWENDSADYTGNTGVWGQISVDEDLGMVYLPVELPTGDYYGGHRPGNGLFGESVVALDLRTGVRKWHYQLVHHGIWDMDIPCAPMLVDLNVNGRAVKALAQPTKQAFLYMFDRQTGAPIWPIEERPVEQSTVPGEKSSPTQPFPTKPPPYDRQGFTLDDVVDFTPEIHAEALKVVERYHLGPVFTPPVVSKAGGPLGTLAMATAQGGTVWQGGSYDPQTHIAYLYSRKSPAILGLVQPTPGTTDFAWVQGTATGGQRRGAGAGADASAVPGAGPAGDSETALAVHGIPLMKPPYGQITAIDLDRGEILWQVAHGETPDNIKNNPLLKGVSIPRTGRAGIIGTLVTSTLVIAGEAGNATYPQGRGAMLRAYDKTNGKEVGAVFMAAPQTGSPMTYMLGGKQYIVVAMGSADHPAEYVAYKLAE